MEPRPPRPLENQLTKIQGTNEAQRSINTRERKRNKNTNTYTHPSAPIELEHSPNYMLNGRGMQGSKFSPGIPQPPNHNA